MSLLDRFRPPSGTAEALDPLPIRDSPLSIATRRSVDDARRDQQLLETELADLDGEYRRLVESGDGPAAVAVKRRQDELSTLTKAGQFKIGRLQSENNSATNTARARWTAEWELRRVRLLIDVADELDAAVAALDRYHAEYALQVEHAAAGGSTTDVSVLAWWREQGRDGVTQAAARLTEQIASLNAQSGVAPSGSPPAHD